MDTALLTSPPNSLGPGIVHLGPAPRGMSDPEFADFDDPLSRRYPGGHPGPPPPILPHSATATPTGSPHKRRLPQVPGRGGLGMMAPSQVWNCDDCRLARGMTPNGNIAKFRAGIPDIVKKSAAT